MACKRFKSEDSYAEVGDGARQMDIISQLEEIPHVLEQIFLHLDIATLRKTEKVSTTWKWLITSLNIWKRVWKKNMRMSSTWRTFSARMEHLQPQLWDRMKKGDASSYKEACLHVEGNIRPISQSAINNLNFQALPNIDFTYCAIRMTDNYVFIGGKSQVVILNRWTRKLVKEFVYCDVVRDMQLNERFLAVQHYSSNDCEEIELYDVQKLEHIQTFGTIPLDYETEFGLGSDVVFICETSRLSNHLKFGVHRWSPSAARFVPDTETGDRLKVTFVDYLYMRIYVDGKYLILDFNISADKSRLFKVFSLETMQLVRERNFYDKFVVRKEYHDGRIIVQTFPADGQPSRVALWDVDKDTVRPIADHPSQFDSSLVMTHHPYPYQIVVKERHGEIQLLLVACCGQPTVIDMPSLGCAYTPEFPFSPVSFYFDGVQMITRSGRPRSNGRYELLMADLVG